MPCQVSIIIPTLNEEEGIAKTICSIPEKIRRDSEVLVADASADYTPIIAQNLGAKMIRTKKGKGRQMRYAVEKSKGDILIFLDGDGTDPAEYIPKLLEKLKTADLVLGCRSKKIFKNDYPMMRELYRFYRIFVAPPFRLLNFRVSDPLAGFRAIRRKDWDRLNLKSNTFEIETEMNIKAIKLGFVIKEVKIPNLKRCGGVLKSKFGTNPKMWFKILRLFLKYCEDEAIKAKIKKEIKNIFFYQKF
ncbi:MAG: hypothetical protein COU42_02480 [Candidatus Nealsonbacteria bacterium CG10_big_fil_rev_8_21_14_0_10_36_24]|uniref:Glycosyltransferase 2-like domain-containing protein n=2 Tax=Candidatus Nealsoniibacteriota TaxID=1817911 RepID=A0A2M6NSH4_9BACT|nr:MAG: hypothetical protein COU42_02480 [Candidatus Nealsonbacteria bacterium CG10_big_fil_rev_8_21_14_0_10_36_24]